MSGSSSSNPAGDADAAPARPLQMSVHSLPPLDIAADESVRRTAAGRWKLVLVLLACAAPVIASYFTYYVIRPEGRSNYAAIIETAPEMPVTLPLRDLDGRSVDAKSLRGQWLLVVVASGDCDSACEQRLYAQRQMREMTGRERDRIDKVWFVVDDAPVKPALRAALEAAPPTQVLRVPMADLSRWLAPAPGESLGAHLYVVDPMGRWMMRAPSALEPSRFKRDIDRVLRASSSWDTPGR